MISFTNKCSKRWGYDGWALKIHGDRAPLSWTVCTTRAEARALRKSRADLFERGADIVKVKLSVVEVVENE